MDKESAHDKISGLVNRFDEHKESYIAANYNETETRRDFIDPFFKALGWDIDNERGLAEAYREVIHEDRIRIDESVKAPDYCFTVYGQKKFYVEAKKPSVEIRESAAPAYQVRRYGWSAKLPISIITDFHEFAVYDCTKKPSPADKASVARIKYITYKDYIPELDFLWDTFSKENILKGRFDKFASTDLNKKGTSSVDSEFLKTMEEWRKSLALNIALRNEKLSEDEINYAVQQTIDRLIFLRICEDRKIEFYGSLKNLINSESVYEKLIQYFRQADDKYNSGIFDFNRDKISHSLTIDDKVLKSIITEMYYPASPYEFSVIPVEILGNSYEQFLGSVIRLTSGHHAKVEVKPEVRKAGGVYYTPQYIVEYIVKNTVGKLIEKKTPAQINKIKILDPACGSGSFLLGAYQYLLNYHLDYYTANTDKNRKSKNNPLTPDGKLTTAEKKRILTNNIFGVDIDTQAVEVTKLSLLLKCLEGETEASVNEQLSLFHERVLPSLEDNVRCGNSLIDFDFYEGQLELKAEENKKVKPFNWEQGFPGVFEQGGFDVVIGNPPYGFHQIHSNETKTYYKKNYIASHGSFEHYFLFYERSLKLINQNGYHGYIVPVTWLTIPSALALRKYVLDNYNIVEICWLPEFVFKNAKVNTLISIITNNTNKNDNTEVKIYDTLRFINPPIEERTYKKSDFIDSNYSINIFESKSDIQILKKIINNSLQLSDIAIPCSGYNPYEVGKGIAPEGGLQTKETVKQKPYHSDKKRGAQWKPEIIGRDLKRYYTNVTGKRWIKYGNWLAAPRDPNNFKGKRILVQEITGGSDKRIIASFNDGELYHSRDVIPIKIVENDNSLKYDPYYLLGIINSWLITWYHHKRNPKAQKGLFPKVLVSDLSKLPIKNIDFTNKDEKNLYDKIILLVDTIIKLNRNFDNCQTPQEQEQLKNRIEYTDKKIDELVYKLYGLTEEEIKIIENN